MKKRLILFLVQLLFISSLLGQKIEQQNTDTIKYFRLSGILSDSITGEAMPYGIVTIENTAYGAIVDSNGRYVINKIPSGKYTIKARCLGYTTKLYTDVDFREDSLYIADFKLVWLGKKVVIEPNWGRSVIPSRTSSSHIWIEQEIKRMPGN